ncbi:MAG: TIGR03013 family PEP-CTERM/XrtA system glycosyltransferase [Alphaproteobacteria bacterium]|nr:TIGR03013 family PEP-CTERM/XrtA system glycosyltransferase [Alphaproteobacteria bacterium]
MIRLFKHYIPNAVVVLAAMDFVGLVFAGEGGWVLRAHQIHMHVGAISARIPQLLTYALSLQTAMIAMGVYGTDALTSLRFSMARLLAAISLGIIVLSVLVFVVPGMAWWRSNLFYAMVLSYALLMLLRMMLARFLGGEAFKRRILVLGAGMRAQRLQELARQPGAGFMVVGFIAMNPGRQVIDEAVLRDAIPNLAEHVTALRASELVLALEERRGALPLNDLIRVRTTGVHVNEISTFLERETGRVDLDSVNPSWLIFSDGFSSGRRLSALAKRVFDIVLSALLLLTTLPIMLMTALAIRLESNGPVIYRQSRVGLYGQTFDVLKLRSMRADAEAAGAPIWARENDPRVTRIGKFIRKVRIDELPQTWNVLVGEMSFVGPRPERPAFVEELTAQLPYFAERHMVKPGITGWAQVNYPYGACLEDSRQKLEYDLYYAKNYTPFLDFVIILQTLRVIIWADGAR